MILHQNDFFVVLSVRMELRCVIAVIRHGDRTPKQKMKMEVRNPMCVLVISSKDLLTKSMTNGSKL